MRKLMLTITMCLGFFAGVKASNTDVSALANTIYIEPVTAAAGTQTTLSVKMKSDELITGYEFFLSLPSGVFFAKDDEDFYLTALSTARTTAKKTNYFDCTVDTDGKLHVLCSTSAADPVTNSLYTFSGYDGEVCTIVVDIPADLVPGDYPLILSSIVMTPSTANKSFETERVETTLTVTAPIDKTVTIDETSTTIPEVCDDVVPVKVKRSIKGGQWNTLCLPFAMTEAQIKKVFGNDVMFAGFVDYETEFDADDKLTDITVNFMTLEVSDGLEANYPCLVKTSKDISEFELTTTIETDEELAVVEYDNGRTGTRRKVYGSMVGVYKAQTTVPANCLFVSDNKFWYSAGLTKINGLRAYFDFVDILSSVDDTSSVKFNFSLYDEATGISEIIKIKDVTDNSVYDINGRILHTPQKGLNIVGGKKVIVK